METPANAAHDGAGRSDTLAFLLELARALHLAYVPADELEARVVAAGRALGRRTRIFTLQSVAFVEVDGKAHELSFARQPFGSHWRLAQLDPLLKVSEGIEAGSLTLTEARREIDRLHAIRTIYPSWAVMIGYVLYAMAVAARVGGAVFEMLVGGLVGVVSGLLHYGASIDRRIDLQRTFLGGLLGTMVVLGLSRVLPPFDSTRALFGGVVLVVPAMLLVIGVHEIANNAVESGVMRLAFAMVRFLMLAFGIYAAGRAWSLFASIPAPVHSAPLPLLARELVVLGGGAALTLCLQARPRDAIVIAGSAAYAFGVEMATRGAFGPEGSPFLTAFAIGVAGLVVQRWLRRPPAIVWFPGLLQVAPGFLGTESVLALLGRPGVGGSANGFFHVVLVALQLTTGLLAGELVAAPLTRPRQKRGRSQTS